MGTLSSWEPLELASDDLRALVLPTRGGDVVSLEHRPTGTQLLWNPDYPTPAGPRVPPAADFHDWYLGGWSDLFPNGGAPAEVDGIAHEQHGTAWRTPWRATSIPGGVELATELAVLPLRARKTIVLDGPTLRLNERIEHAGDAPLRMMWGQHPTWGGDLLASGARIDLPGGRTQCFGARVDATSRIADTGSGRWPHLPGRDGAPVDLSVVPGPEAKSHDVCLITELAGGWYALRNAQRGVGVAMRFDPAVFRFLWLWQPFGGATLPPFDHGMYAMALEMWTSRPSLGAAVEDGSAVTLAPGAALDAEFELTAFAADERPVTGVGPGGAVQHGPRYSEQPA